MKNQDFELPSETEKLSHKYILDALKAVKNVAAETAPEEEALSLPEEPRAQGSLPSLELPQGKRYFRMQEVSRLIGVEPHVLRYWQSEFSVVRPEKSGNGHWVYSRRDVELFHTIRHLLHVEKFSIQGAKKRLKTRNAPAAVSTQHAETLRWLAKELKGFLSWARETTV